MEKSSRNKFEEFGGRVASAWEGLRPTTRSMVERALQTSSAAGAGAALPPYDARSEFELSRLLSALDERATGLGAQEVLSAEQSRELVRVADACAFVLRNEARSAEVFALLLVRALRARDYTRVDEVADTLSARLAPTEVCELARSSNQAVRAIAHEALAQKPTSILIELLGDPLDAEVAREALEIQADDYNSEEARWVVVTLARADEECEEE